ncbi:MAG: Crossover junction endodeoxyribonuclease RuvC [bacterium 42_11]|nr:MAG: Crossover junction endodeoxyribonuclease RuvC [bacterium 42_11]
MRVIGIDPGLRELGYAILDEAYTLLKTETLYTSPDLEKVERLRIIYDRLYEEIDKYYPSLLCLESLFFHRNARSAMEVGEVRGVISLLCAHKGLRLLEISPLQLKRALTNWGRASKKDMAEVLKKIFGFQLATSHEVDAAALAVCGLTFLKRSGSIDDKLS